MNLIVETETLLTGCITSIASFGLVLSLLWQIDFSSGSTYKLVSALLAAVAAILAGSTLITFKKK